MTIRSMYFTNVTTGKQEMIEVSRFWENAIIPKGVEYPDGTGHGNDIRLTGINVGISIPHDSKEAYVEFRNKLKFDGFFTVHVESIPETGMKSIHPVIVHDGNAYDAAYGSSCLWGYLAPVGFDDRPTAGDKGSFGVLPMCLGN